MGKIIAWPKTLPKSSKRSPGSAKKRYRVRPGSLLDRVLGICLR